MQPEGDRMAQLHTWLAVQDEQLALLFCCPHVPLGIFFGALCGRLHTGLAPNKAEILDLWNVLHGLQPVPGRLPKACEP